MPLGLQALLTPMQNSLLFAGTPVAIAAGMFMAQRLSRAVGRVPAILTFRWLGVALMVIMALAHRLWTLQWVILPIYLLRTACANCTSPIARSILMDFVSKVRLRFAGVWSFCIFSLCQVPSLGTIPALQPGTRPWRVCMCDACTSLSRACVDSSSVSVMMFQMHAWRPCSAASSHATSAAATQPCSVCCARQEGRHAAA
jgi:MFS family permease